MLQHMEVKQLELLAHRCTIDELQRLFYLIVKKLSDRGFKRLHCIRLGDCSVAWGDGKEWSAKIQAIYQSFLEDEIGPMPSSMSVAFLSNIKVKDFLDSLSFEQLDLIGEYAKTKRLECQSSSPLLGPPTPKSSSSEKPLEETKNEVVSPSQEVPDNS